MRHELVAAGETDGGRLRDRFVRREQRVDPREQALPLRAGGRVAEPVRREERRRGQRGGVAQRQIRQARQSRLETVHHVEAAPRKGEREARADADRHAHAAPTGDPHRRADCDQLRVVEVSEQGASPGCQIAGAVRGGQDRDRMTASTQLTREPVHVLVHVVRLRPGERRD